MILANQQLIIFPYFLISLSQIHNILVQYLPSTVTVCQNELCPLQTEIVLSTPFNLASFALQINP